MLSVLAAVLLLLHLTVRLSPSISVQVWRHLVLLVEQRWQLLYQTDSEVCSVRLGKQLVYLRLLYLPVVGSSFSVSLPLV